VSALLTYRNNQSLIFSGVSSGYSLTSDMVTACEFVEVDATARTRARDLLDGIERPFLIFVAALCGSLVVLTRLFFVEWHLTAKAVTSFARSAVENVAVVFGEEGPFILVSMFAVGDWIQRY
jgi:hypothetical protein